MEVGTCLACLTLGWGMNYSNQSVVTEVNFTLFLLIEKENENVTTAWVSSER